MPVKNDVIVSIIVPVFNRKELLKEAIDSVLAQCDPMWELLLIDDGSTDGAADVARIYSEKDNRIRFFIRPDSRKKGANACRNIGLENALGKYIVFLDSDDLLANFCVQMRRKTALEFSSLDFLVFPMLLFKERCDDLRILQNMNTNEDALVRFLSRENVWLMSSVLWEAGFIRRLGGFNEELLSFQDWEINVRALCMSNKFQFFDQMIPDNYYRQHENSISANRYGLNHTINNSEMVLSVFKRLKTSHKYSDDKRALLAGFFVDLINRYRYFPIAKQERVTQQLRWLNEAAECGLIKENERENVWSYLSRSRSLWSARFSFIRKLNEKKFKSGVLQHFFPVITKKQGKISYDGPLY